MRVQVIFRWSRSRKDRFQGEGTTRDVSLAGAYVFSETCPPVNTMVQMEIILPSLSTAPSTRMRAEMKVLRVDGDISSERPGGFSLAKGFPFVLTRRNNRSLSWISLLGLRENYENPGTGRNHRAGRKFIGSGSCLPKPCRYCSCSGWIDLAATDRCRETIH